MHILALSLQLTLAVLKLLLDGFDLSILGLSLFIVSLKLAEQFSELRLDRIATLLSVTHVCARLVLLSDQLFEFLLELLDLLILLGHLEVILGVIRLLQFIFWHGRHDCLDCHKQIIAALLPLCELVL